MLVDTVDSKKGITESFFEILHGKSVFVGLLHQKSVKRQLWTGVDTGIPIASPKNDPHKKPLAIGKLLSSAVHGTLALSS